MHYVRLFHDDGSEIGGVLLFFFGGVSLGAALIWLITDFLGLGAVFFFFFSRVLYRSLLRIITLFRFDYPALHRRCFFLCSVGSAFWELRKGMRFQMNQLDCTVE